MDDEAMALFRRGIEGRLSYEETFDQTMDVIFRIAEIRSGIFGRGTSHLDLEVVASGLCWWPLKPPPSERYQEQVQSVRAYLGEFVSTIDFAVFLEPFRREPPGFLLSGRAPQDESELLFLLTAVPADLLVNFFISISE